MEDQKVGVGKVQQCQKSSGTDSIKISAYYLVKKFQRYGLKYISSLFVVKSGLVVYFSNNVFGFYTKRGTGLIVLWTFTIDPSKYKVLKGELSR